MAFSAKYIETGGLMKRAYQFRLIIILHQLIPMAAICPPQHIMQSFLRFQNQFIVSFN